MTDATEKPVKARRKSTAKVGVSNTGIWDSVQETNPRYTKEFSKAGGFRGTAINPTYVMRKLTEQFGPCGMGWRMVIVEDGMLEGHEIAPGQRTLIHRLRGYLTYKVDGEWYNTSEQYGQTTFVGSNKHGCFTDEEAPKKTATDLMTKCAVQLGACADIHLGLYDSVKYVNDLKERLKAEAAQSVQAPTKAPPKAPPKPEEEAKEEAPTEKKGAPVVACITPAEAKEITEQCKRAGLDVRMFCRSLDIGAVTLLPASQKVNAVERIGKYAKAKAEKEAADAASKAKKDEK